MTTLEILDPVTLQVWQVDLDLIPLDGGTDERSVWLQYPIAGLSWPIVY